MGLLQDVSAYVIECDIELKNNETIGFTDEQKLRITVSKGAALVEDTIKIEF